MYHEYCVCPERDASVWRSALQCPEDEPQIQQDFISFPSIDLQRLLQEVPQRFSRRGGLVHYSLINNQLHRRSLGKYTDFKMFSDEMLLSLARKVRLAAYGLLFRARFTKQGKVVFLWQLIGLYFVLSVPSPPGEITGCGVLYKRRRLADGEPEGGWGARPVAHYLLVRLHRHAWHHPPHVWHHTLVSGGHERRHQWPAVGPGQHRCTSVHHCPASACVLSLTLWIFTGSPGPVWADKTEKAFFRGRDSREERLQLVTMSKENPELLDAGITAYFFFRDREKDLGKAPMVGFFDFFKVSDAEENLQ